MLALGLHAGLGYGAHEAAKRVERQYPLRLKTFLVDKQLMKEIVERIKQIQQHDDLIDIALEDIPDLKELEQAIDEIPEPDGNEAKTALDTSYDDSAYAAAGDAGEMGNPNAQESGNRYAIKGPPDNPDPHIARQAALRDAAEFGMIGLLNTGAGGDPDAPTAPWGRDDALSTDPLSARGNMWGDEIGESFGAGGLGLAGIGEGGGGTSEGIGLGSVGTIGHGAGTGTGQGFGSGHGRLGRSHRASPPRVKMGSTTVSGTLPPEVIQRIVRSHFGRFRVCYQSALKSKPNLKGRVNVRFTIGATGTVSNVEGSGNIPDQGVIACVTRAFYALSFPQPEGGGTVTVSYPIDFAPGVDSSSSDPPPKTAKRKRTSANVQVRSVSAGGGLDDGAVKRTLNSKSSAFRGCYERARQSEPDLRGSVHLRFRVDTSGSAVIGKREDAIVSTVSDSVADCALAAISRLTFPKPERDADVSFRLTLSPD